MPKKETSVPLDKVSIMRSQGMSFSDIAEVLGIPSSRLRKAWSRGGLHLKLAETKALVEERNRQIVTKRDNMNPIRSPEELMVATVTSLNEDPVTAYKKAAGKVVNRIAQNIAMTDTSDPKAMAGQAVTIKTINDVAKTVYGLEKDTAPSFVFNMGSLENPDNEEI